MKELVFKPQGADTEPFTTSDIVAEFAGVQHHTITRLIRNHGQDFLEFGKVGFEIHASPSGRIPARWGNTK